MGYRTNEEYKITSNTKKVLVIKCIKNNSKLRGIRMEDFIKEVLVTEDQIKKELEN